MARFTALNLLGGMIDAELTESSMRWRVKLNAQHLDGRLLQKHSQPSCSRSKAVI